MPVLITCGDEDRLIPTINSIELAGVLPEADLVIFLDVDHRFLFQHPEKFAKIVNAFLHAEKGDIRKKLNKVRLRL